MSILGQIDLSLAILLGGALVAAVLAMGLRVQRPRLIAGPERTPPNVPVWPLVLVLTFGFCAWFGMQVAFSMWKIAQAPSDQTVPAFDLASLSAGEWAYLATAPPVVGFMVLWAGDFMAGGLALLARIGFSLRRLPAGVGAGLLASLIILPPTYIVSWLTEVVFKLVHYQHPPEHDLLRIMGQSHEVLWRVLLILGAVAAAPLFEEFLFRGHVQTLIRSALVRLSMPRVAARGFAVQVPSNEVASAISADDAQPLPPPMPVLELGPRVWQPWLALILTSAIFAMVHPMWMWPPIFFLALGLGYVYERTGNLWVNMTVHFMFNSVSTILYLVVVRHGG